jgi:hypothetical protein
MAVNVHFDASPEHCPHVNIPCPMPSHFRASRDIEQVTCADCIEWSATRAARMLDAKEPRTLFYDPYDNAGTQRRR